MTDQPGPTQNRRRPALTLQQLHGERGRSTDDAAAAMYWSRTKAHRVMAGDVDTSMVELRAYTAATPPKSP